MQRAANAADGRISFRFDTLEIHGRKISIVTGLRAIAGFMEVQAAQTPEFSPGFGTPYIWANTRQIGGDEVYGVGRGPVTSEKSGELWGKGFMAASWFTFARGPNQNVAARWTLKTAFRLSWVFSSDACGVYGIQGSHHCTCRPHEAPIGEIALVAEQRDLLVRGASGMLLRVIRIAESHVGQFFSRQAARERLF